MEAKPIWPIVLKGGYKVQEVPTPKFKKLLLIKNKKEILKIQNLKEVRRGKIRSWLFIINGINQLPKPPNMAGITIKKIIINACWVNTTL
jgi:hypothetical protein